MPSEPMKHYQGFTLVELMVSIGLFAIVMMLAMGAYLVMINLGREAQALTTGTNNLSYALEHITRNIRTGRGYGSAGVACGTNLDEFSFRNNQGQQVVYSCSNSSGDCGAIQETIGGSTVAITDPSVTVKTLSFTCAGEGRWIDSPHDTVQAHVLINIFGTVETGHGRPPKEFYVQTFATMRGRDL